MKLLKILNKIKQARAIPVRVLITKITRKIIENIRLKIKLKTIENKSVYKNYSIDKNIINYTLGLKLVDSIKINTTQNITLTKNLANNFINHKFNLLGSGWVNVSHKNEYEGFHSYKYIIKIEYSDKFQFIENFIKLPNQEYSKKLMELLPTEYELIDWQRDFRSGYRWSELKWHKLLKIAEQKGAEIKLPWELGRMQHLITFYHAWSDLNNELYLNEFQYQIIDFIASNPPGFGLQWFNSMEAAIRASNWILVFNLFKNFGAKFIEGFEDIFVNSIVVHGEYIFNNLEWSDGMRGNHYFSNIVGLIIISTFLNGNTKSNKWLEFAVQELINEIYYQFYDDGGNFEHSIAYHLFVVEMLINALSALVDISGEQKEILIKNKKISGFILNSKSEFQNKLNSIFEFSINLLNENHSTFYSGDMDSGYFFRYNPVFKPSLSEIVGVGLDFNLNNYTELIFLLKKLTSSNIEKNNFSKYNDFGLYIYNKEKYSASITFGNIDKRSKGAHSHNDLLSINLNIGGIDFLIDPGTYNYTAIPEYRNKFRSTAMHNTLQLENIEQNDFIIGSPGDLFWLRPKAELNLLKCDDNEFSASHNGFGVDHKRHILFENNKISGKDYCNSSKIKYIRFYLNENVIIKQIEKNIIKLENSTKVVLFKVKNENIIVEKNRNITFLWGNY